MLTLVTERLSIYDGSDIDLNCSSRKSLNPSVNVVSDTSLSQSISKDMSGSGDGDGDDGDGDDAKNKVNHQVWRGRGPSHGCMFTTKRPIYTTASPYNQRASFYSFTSSTHSYKI